MAQAGINRLSMDQVMRLGAARSYLNHHMDILILSKGSYSLDPISFYNGPCSRAGCSSAPRLSQSIESVKQYLRQADLLLWIKAYRDGVVQGASSLCGSCTAAWNQQATRRMLQVFGEFSSLMGVTLPGREENGSVQV